MKINEIINEAKQQTPQQIAEIIKRDCAPFLAMIDNNPLKYELWRGSYDINSFFVKHECPVNRSPRDTDYTVSRIVDEWFLDKTGIRFRSNATFATGNILMTDDYGPPYLVFPIGEFSFSWSSKVADMTYDLLDVQGADGEDPEFITDLLDDAGYTLNDNMKSAILHGHEVMIHCPDGFYTLSNRINGESKKIGEILSYIMNPPSAEQTQDAIIKLLDELTHKKSYLASMINIVSTLSRALKAPMAKRRAMTADLGLDDLDDSHLEDDELTRIINFWSLEVANEKRAVARVATKLKKLQK